MKFLKKIFAALFAVCIIFSLTVSVEATKKVVAVMPLENVSGYNTDEIAEIMTEELMVALQKSGKYSVIERAQMATILREQGFQNIAADPDSAVKMGKLTGANYSLIGKVTMATLEKNVTSSIAESLASILSRNLDDKTSLELLQSAGVLVHSLKGKVSVDIRFVNNETGELVFARNFIGTKSGNSPEAALLGACQEAADNFLKEITANVMGRVADISGEEIYIDLGIESGLQKGDIISIVRETSPIEINGKIVGMKTIQIGKAEIIEVNAEYSVCKVVSVQKGDAVHKGDVVKRS